MNDLFKRFLSLTLAILMVVSYIPTSAFASEPETCEQCNYESVTTDPTCVDAGYTTYTCSVCGDTYTEEATATGHSFTDGVCTVCGAADPDASEPDEGDEGGEPDAQSDELTATVTWTDAAGTKHEEQGGFDYDGTEEYKISLGTTGLLVGSTVEVNAGEYSNSMTVAEEDTGYGEIVYYWQPSMYELYLGFAGSAITPDEPEEPAYVAKIGETGYATLAEAVSAASAMTGDVTVEIYGKADSTGISLNNANITSLNFVGKTDDAEICIDGLAYVDVRYTSYPVTYTGLILSHINGGYGGDGRLQEYFSTYNGGDVTYNSCSFPNGVTAMGSKDGTTVTFNDCTFNNTTSGKYSLWVDGNGTNVVVNGGTFCGVRGAKLFAENGAAFSSLTVKGATFSDTITEKAAIVLTRGESVALSSNTYKNTTDKVQVDDDYASEIEGKTVVIEGTEYVVDSENLELDETAPAYVAKIGEQGYESLQAAVTAVKNGETITLLADITEELVNIDKDSGVAFTIDGNSKNFTGEFEIGIGENIVIKNVNFVASAEISPEYFIDSMDQNSNCVLTIQNCTFTDTDYSTTAIGTHQPTKVVIDGCTTAGVASLLQNQGGYDITVKNTNVEGKRGISLGTVVGATVENVTIKAADDKYGIRLNGEIANNTITIKDVKISAFIPVVVRKAQVENYTVVFGGTNTMTPANTDGLWLAIGSSEYETNGTMPTAPTGKVLVTLNDPGLDKAGVYGNYIESPEGSGTAEDPYLITNLDDLIWFRDKVDEQATDGSTQFAGKYFKLTADIDLAGINWNPIGSMSGDHGSFKGVFDGDGHTISNLNVQQAGNGIGLFARTAGNAEIKNLTLNNVTVKSTDNSNYVGGLVGNAYASTKISNVHVTGNVDISGRGYIGGIAGHGYVVMDNVSVVGTGTISSTFWCAGGILGYAGEGATNIMNAHVEGITITSAAGGLGAIVGMAEDNNGTQPISGSNLSAKNVDIKTYTGAYGDSYANYALGYLYGGNPTSKLTGTLSVENVKVETSSGETPNIVDVAAKVDNAIYFDLQSAVNAADGKTVVVNKDIVLADTLSISAGKTVTLDLNGETISQTKACTESYEMIANNGTLTITGDGKISFKDTGAGDPNAGWGSYTIRNSGTLVVENGTIEHLGEQNQAGQAFAHTTLAIFQYSGSTTINGGTISTPNYRSVRLWSGDMTINGGTFDGQVWVHCVNDTSKLTITGGEFSPNGNDGSSVFVNNSGKKAELSVTGGTFATKIGADSPATLDGELIRGGTFTEAAVNGTNAALLAAGYVFEQNEDGTYGIAAKAASGEIAYRAYIEASASREAVKVDLQNVYAKESVVVKLYDANGNLLTTTTLKAGAYEGEYLTTNIVLSGTASGSWDTVIHAEKLTVANVPTKGELCIDGTLMDTFEPILGNATDAAAYQLPAYLALDCVYKEAKIGDTYYATLADAFAAAQDGDEVTILEAGTYALSTSGKDITITGAVDGVVFDNIGAKNMGSADVTFNNVTFDYYPNVNYTGLQHSGNLVYNNCIINGQVFLYGTSETFNECTFNQNSADAYNVWTYGAKEVAFNECTFNSVGKAVLVYTESSTATNDVTVTKSTFNASAPVEGKAAIEIDTSLSAGATITIDGDTTATGFGSGNVSGNSLWNNKKGNNTDANNDLTVVVNNETVLAPVTFAAKVGENKYATLQDAINATNGVGTVTLMTDVTENLTIPTPAATTADEETAVQELVIDLNGKTLYGYIAPCTANLTVKNGSIVNTNSDFSAIEINAGTLVLENVNVKSARHGVRIDGNVGAVTAIINGGKYTVNATSGTRHAVNISGDANVTIKSGEFVGPADTTMDSGSAVCVQAGATATIEGGTFSGGKNATLGVSGTMTVTGGIFDQDVTDFCKTGYAALPDLNGNYVVGVKPTATVKDLGAMTIPEDQYMVYGGSKNGDMPLSFVMQFLADQKEEDMATSPFAEWYGDFVITFTGIEEDSFTANGCYLAGHYGTFGWVKVPVDGMTIEEGARYPVMLGVGMGQKYDYICSSVQDFKCALYLTPEILAANPNLQVKLELAVVDNSKGSDAAANALISNEKVYSVTDYTYGAEDFLPPVAQIGETKYATLAKAIEEAQAGNTITFLADITEDVTVNKNVIIDGANFKYTGTMTANAGLTVTVQNVNFVNGGFDKSTKSTTGNYTIKNCTFTDDGKYPYALRFKGANSITIEDCTVANYQYSFLYVSSGTNNVSVKNVTVENCPNYAVYFASGVNQATFENLTVKNSDNGFLINNTANRAFTIKNCTMENVATPINHSKGTNTITCTALGVNDFGGAANSEYVNVVGAQLVGTNKFGDLQAMIGEAKDGDTVKLLSDIDLAKTELQDLDGYDTYFLVEGKSVTVDLNGKTISGEYTGNLLVGVFSTDKNGHLTLTGNGTVDVTATGKVYTLITAFNTGSTVTIKNGTYKLDKASDSLIFYGGEKDAELTVEGGTFNLGNLDDVNGPWIFNVLGAGDHHVLVTGGTFNADINRQKWSNEVLVSETCYTVNNGDGTWTVEDGAVAYVATGMTTGPYFVRKNIGYATIEEAFAAAVAYNDVNITLLKDVQLAKDVKISIPGIILNDNGKKLDCNGKQIILTAADATLTAAADLNVITNVADSKVVYENGVHKVVAKNYVAQVGTAKFESLAEAIEAANAGETVTLLADVTVTSKVIVNKAITIDGNGNDIIADADTTWYTQKPGKLVKTYSPWVVLQADGASFKNVTINANNVAGGVKIENAENVVFDNVAIIGTKADAITVVGSLNLKNSLKVETTSSVIDARNGVVNAEAGTVFDMTKWGGNVSPATSDLKAVVDTEGNPFFCAYSSTSYYKTMSGVLNATDLTLLDYVNLTGNITVKGTLDLNGNDLTVAEGKFIKVETALTLDGEGEVAGEFSLTKETATLTAPEGLNVTTTVADHMVVYVNGAYAVVAPVAKIGDVLYATLAEAVAAAKKGDTITLLADVEISENIEIGKSLTIAENGNTLTTTAEIILTDAAATLTAPEGLTVTTTVADNVVEYEDGVYKVVEKYVAQNTDTGTKYETVADAINAATAGQTIVLITDAEAQGMVILMNDATLDLNGYTLEASHFIQLEGTQVLNSKTTGILKVPQNSISLQKSNVYVPVWNEVNGYYMIEWGFSWAEDRKTEGKYDFYFLPKPRNAGVVNTAVVDLLKNGAADNELKIEVYLSWSIGDADSKRTFTFKEEMISTVYTTNSNLSTTGGTVFRLTVTGYDNIENVTLQAAVVSERNPVDTLKEITIK